MTRIIHYLRRTLAGRSLGVARSSQWTFLGRALEHLCRFATSVVLARILLPAGKGQLAILILIPSTLHAVGNLGLFTSIRHLGGKEPGAARALSANNLLASALMAAVYGAGLAVLFRAGGLDGLGDFLRWGHVLLMGPALFFLFFVDTSRAVLLARNYVAARNVLRLTHPTVFFVILGGLAAAGRADLDSAFAAWVASLAVSGGLCGVFLWRLSLLRARPSLRLLGRSLRIGARALFGTLAAFIILRSDLYLVQHFSGDAATGIYSVAASLSLLLFAVPESVGMALFPHVARAEHVEGEDGAAQAALACRLTNLLLPLVGLAAMATAPLLIRCFYGPGFSPAVWPFLILALAAMAAGPAFVVDALLTARGIFWSKSLLALLAAGLNIGLNILLIPPLSTVGAALASLVSYGLVGFGLCYVYCRSTGASFGDLVPGRKDLAAVLRVVRSRLGPAPKGEE